ncbi:MAG: C1 family peptidase [candidate division Zixibacteria bacterium]
MYAMYSNPELPEEGRRVGTGWLPPLPDFRDFNDGHKELKELKKKLKIPDTVNTLKAFPGQVDLRQWCSPIENQGSLGSCTAQAGVGIVEYFENRAFKKHIDGSRLFVYKTTRNLMGVSGDTGAWLRNTMGALALCGVAPEKYWPYTDQSPQFDEEPTSFVYSVADNYEAIKYFCHDPQGQNIPPDQVLKKVKLFLAFGIPSMFGFYGFSSANQSNVKGGIPFPCPGERAQWGHAIVAVGYNDNLEITNKMCRKKTKGALLFRNSWGAGWGDKGYGWLPYDYILNRIALDFWSLLNMEWVETGQFDFSA